MEAFSSDPNKETMGIEDGDDEIYEDIEAPKYVDFTVPDRAKPDSSSWFCDRIGCDRTHEEVDPDAVYKSFVLRVLAARSPNVRLQKALDRPGRSLIPKCPHSAPAKSAKDRAMRFSRITSIPEKMATNKLRDHQISGLRSTPKSRPPTAEKALTTPRNKKCPSHHEPFRSVKHQKVAAEAPKRRAIAKALFVQTPKKAGQTDRTPCSLGTPVSEVSNGMKKLKVGSTKKHGPKGQSCNLPRCAAYDSTGLQQSSFPEKPNLHSIDAKKVGAEGAMAAKNPLETSDSTIHGKGLHNHSSDMETEIIEVNLCSVESAVIEPIDTVVEDDKTVKNSEKMHNASTDLEEGGSLQPNSNVAGAQHTIKEDAFDADDDDKENASDACPTSSVTTNVTNSESLSSQIENGENSHSKAINQPSRANLHERTTHGGKYKRTKPTYPKPFRLRTDERGILKEANMERRLQLEAQKENLSVTKRKDGMQKNTSNGQDGRIDSDIRLKKAQPAQTKAARQKLEQDAEIKSDGSKEKTAEKLAKKTLNGKPTSAVTPRKLPSSQLGRSKGTLKTIREEREENTTSTRIPSSRRKKPPTIPKEPKFHRTHVPKSCIKRPEMMSS